MKRRLLAALLGFALALGVAEVALRVLGVGAAPLTKIALVDVAADELRFHCFPSNPDGVFEPLPERIPSEWLIVELQEPPIRVGLEELAARPWCIEYRYSRQGVRGPAVTDRPMPWAKRVVGIGDSFAFGEGVRHEETLFPRLNAALGDKVEVVNCARSGADLELDVGMLEWAARELHPSHALLVLTLNDVAATELGPADLINVRGTAPAAIAWSRVASLIHQIATSSSRSAATTRMYLDAHDVQKNRAGLLRAEGLLRRAAAVPGVSVAVVIFPLMHQLDDYPFEPAHAELAARARAAGMPVLDLLPAFRGQDANELHVHPIDHHPNAKAHGIAAAEIARWLRDDIPGFLNR